MTLPVDLEIRGNDVDGYHAVVTFGDSHFAVTLDDEKIYPDMGAAMDSIVEAFKKLLNDDKS